MRQKIAVLALGMLLCLPASLARADDAAARQAAEAYLAATGGFAGQIDATIEALALRLPADHQERFTRFMHDALDPAEIEAIAVDGMVEHFTADELDALAQFYGSEPGRSIAAKFPAFFIDTMEEVQRHISQQASTFEP